MLTRQLAEKILVILDISGSQERKIHHHHLAC
jgi:hypothetical protein